MIRILVVLAILVALGALKLPIEHDLAALHRHEHFRGVEFNLDLREKLGQLGFVAALSGFRAIVADALFIQAHVAWERIEWGRILLLFRHITTLQPRVLLFWDTAAWHMAWNISYSVSQYPGEGRAADDHAGARGEPHRRRAAVPRKPGRPRAALRRQGLSALLGAEALVDRADFAADGRQLAGVRGEIRPVYERLGA